jgi:cytochrome d ubiquinol oxidase subunit II
VWDGNETWLVLGGAGLLTAFPLAYSVVLTALYLPIILMLVGLVFRGVAFEFRFKASDQRRHWWDKAFICGSMLATFSQGVTLGAYIGGIRVVDGSFAGGAFDWLTPFSIFTGIALLAAYALLGSTWLVMKTEEDLLARARAAARAAAWAVLAAIVVISVWTPLLDPGIAHRWFSLPNLFYFAPVPVLVLVSLYLLIKTVRGDAHSAPFICALALVFLGYTGLGISVWPNVIPPAISIWDAAAPAQSMGFALVGALLIVPIILMYTAWGYYVFRGKVRRGEGYH